MKSFNGIALGIVISSLLLSGCKGVDNWWKREHALKPLKEQYWNGELSWTEYRAKKEALIDDLERRDYRTPEEHAKVVREKLDSHAVNVQAEAMAEKEDDEIVLRQDEAMIADTEKIPTTKAEVIADARAENDSEAPTEDEIDYNMLSRSVEGSNRPRAAATAPTTRPVTTSGEETITDSKDIRWKKSHDGTIIYEDPKKDELPKQVIRDGSVTPAPEVKVVPVEPVEPVVQPEEETKDAEPAPSPEAKHQSPMEKEEEMADPAREQEEPEALDMNDL